LKKGTLTTIRKHLLPRRVGHWFAMRFGVYLTIAVLVGLVFLAVVSGLEPPAVRPVGNAGIVTLTLLGRHEAEVPSCVVEHHTYWAHVSCCQILKASDRIAR
jgi:hypothetical protein